MSYVYPSHGRYTPEQYDEASRLYVEEHMSAPEAAEETGVEVSALYRFLRRNGLTRTISQTLGERGLQTALHTLALREHRSARKLAEEEELSLRAVFQRTAIARRYLASLPSTQHEHA